MRRAETAADVSQRRLRPCESSLKRQVIWWTCRRRTCLRGGKSGSRTRGSGTDSAIRRKQLFLPTAVFLRRWQQSRRISWQSKRDISGWRRSLTRQTAHWAASRKWSSRLISRWPILTASCGGQTCGWWRWAAASMSWSVRPTAKTAGKRPGWSSAWSITTMRLSAV